MEKVSNVSQGNEISLLQEELDEKIKTIDTLQKDKQKMVSEINSKNEIIVKLNNDMEIEQMKSSH